MDQPIVKAGDTFGGKTYSRDIMAPPFDVNCRCGLDFKYAGESSEDES